MPDILKNANSEEIVKAIETNTYEYRKWYSQKIPNTETIQSDEYFLFCSGLSYGFTNFVIDIRISDDSENKINEIVSFFQKRKVPFVCFVGPNTKPENIRELLIKNNFRLRISEPAMAYFLDELTPIDIPLDSLVVKKVKNQEEMLEWNNIRKRVFNFPEEVISKSFLISVLDRKVTAFIAYLENEPIATSLVFYHEDIAGIYSVTTVPEHRGKGIGTYMTYLTMVDAKEKGSKIITLHSSDMGLKVYRKMGFQEYDKIEIYFWKPK